MALYAIGDLHLCLGAPKPMDVFGGAWVGYMEKLREGMQVIRPEDTTVLLGDLSWALDLQNASADFLWIHQHIPGRKIILKGNHDYWWSTAAKFYRFCQENGIENQFILNNNHYEYEGWAICGTRGWFFEEERSGAHDEKVFRRELMRLEASLQSAGDLPKLVFLHYPPRYKGYVCQEILELLEKYEVRRCFYGHLHGAAQNLAQEGLWSDTEFRLLSADRLNFKPFRVIS
ncbi:MAG TPA: metallophosphoesterase [Candidatus Faecousia intestinigallinarum]|nr:metallophosphoesterase [Candidatus Faecousia intestinigallinarum]